MMLRECEGGREGGREGEREHQHEHEHEREGEAIDPSGGRPQAEAALRYSSQWVGDSEG